MTEKLLSRIETLKYVVQQAKYDYLREMAGEEFTRLLEESGKKLGEKVGHIEKIKVPNLTGLTDDRVDKEKILEKCDQLKKVLEISHSGK